MNHASAILKAALEYQALGWSVLPLHGIVDGHCTCGITSCGSPGKHPIGKWKHRQAVAATQSELTELFSRYPNANVGIATGSLSGIFVLDIDDPALFTGHPIIRGMAEKFRGPMAITGRLGGGFHCYFRHPGAQVANFTKKLPGLDGRGDGGYVVAPPSRHETGKAYEFPAGYGAESPLQDLPPELGALLFSEEGTISARARAAVAGEVARVLSSREGARNDTLNTAAFNLGQLCGADELPRHDVERELLSAATGVGLSNREAEKTIASGVAAGMSKPRSQRIAPTTGSVSTPEFNPPDMRIVDGTRARPPAFPIAVLGPKWSAWCTVASDNAGVPVDYVAAPLLAAAATLIGNAIRVTPSKGWEEACHLWLMTVGDPSDGKTPGLRPVLKLIEPLDRQLQAKFKADKAEWKKKFDLAKIAEGAWEKACKKALEAGRPVPDKPAEANVTRPPDCGRVILNDSTREALGLLSQTNPKGLLFFRDELAGWMKDFDRYGGDGQRQDWLEAYNGGPRTIDRIKHPEPIHIPHWSIGVLGGIQPDKLVECLFKTADDGLSARFLYSWPDPLPFQRPREEDLPSFAEGAFKKLFSLPLSEDENGNRWPTVKRLSLDASEAFQLWREQHHKDRPSSALLRGHYGKMPGMVLRLAVTIEYLRWAADDIAGQSDCINFGDTIQEVSEASLLAGVTLIEDYFKPMAFRVFRDAALPESDKLATTLARWILQEQPKRFNASHLRTHQGCPSGLKEAVQMNKACEALRDYGWVRYVGERNDGRAGRKTLEWEVNPALFATRELD